MVCKIFNDIASHVKGKIMFINHGRRDGQNIPMVEVKIDTKEAAMSPRRCFVAKKKSGHDFGHLHLANSVTLRTMVRTDKKN